MAWQAHRAGSWRGRHSSLLHPHRLHTPAGYSHSTAHAQHSLVRCFAASAYPRAFTPPATQEAAVDSSPTPALSESAEVRHFLSALPLDLSEFSDKFSSFTQLLNAPSRTLKAFGLNIAQRKQLLLQRERYKASLRTAQMLQLLSSSPPSASPLEVQQALYDVLYPHVYARQWRRAEEREAGHWWRQSVTMARLRKSYVRNEWNGVHAATNPESLRPLRNPEAMKERLREELAKLKDQQERGVDELLDELDLVEHSDIMDDLMHPLVQGQMPTVMQHVKANRKIREEIREQLREQDRIRLEDVKEEDLEEEVEEAEEEEEQQEAKEEEEREGEEEEARLEAKEERKKGEQEEGVTEGAAVAEGDSLAKAEGDSLAVQEVEEEEEDDGEDESALNDFELDPTLDHASQLSAEEMAAEDAAWLEEERAEVFAELKEGLRPTAPPLLSADDPRVEKELFERRVDRVLESPSTVSLLHALMRQKLLDYDPVEEWKGTYDRDDMMHQHVAVDENGERYSGREVEMIIRKELDHLPFEQQLEALGVSAQQLRQMDAVARGLFTQEGMNTQPKLRMTDDGVIRTGTVLVEREGELARMTSQLKMQMSERGEVVEPDEVDVEEDEWEEEEEEEEEEEKEEEGGEQGAGEREQASAAVPDAVLLPPPPAESSDPLAIRARQLKAREDRLRRLFSYTPRMGQ